MRTRFCVLTTGLVTAAFSVGCSDIQARWAFKEANKLYEEEEYREAIPVYERVVEHKPDMAVARFYLASAHQALYRPSSDDPENREHLEIAVREYERTLEDIQGGTSNLEKVKRNTLAVLTSIHSDEPYRDFDQAYSYAERLVDFDPEDTRNLYAMANLYEKFAKIDEAQAQYERIVELNPEDTQACGALAAFYNKPLWEGQSKFDEAISVLHRCAELAGDDPQGYQKVATFYWDKAYRDPLINNAARSAYADKGLEAVDRALEIKPDYFEAYIFKGLLYRVKAGVETSSRLKQQYLEEAEMLQRRGLELREEQEEEAASLVSGGQQSVAESQTAP